jgi:hypothetical protein
MLDKNKERLRTHQNSVDRYRRLLATRLSDIERAYIERRLNEERAAVDALLQDTFPDRFSLRMNSSRTTNLEMAELLHPADAYGHPMDVVEDCDLTSYEKRAILSSWAADACAVKGIPELKQKIDGVVSFDDILDALRVLQSGPDARTGASPGSDHRFGTQTSGDAASL